MVFGGFRLSTAATSWMERDENRLQAIPETETIMDTCARLHLETLYAGQEMKIECYWHLARSL